MTAQRENGRAAELNQPRLVREAAFVGGAWTEGHASLTVTSPASSKALGQIPGLPAAAVADAVSTAHQAFGAWRVTAARERVSPLRRWHDPICDNSDDPARIITLAQGEPQAGSASPTSARRSAWPTMAPGGWQPLYPRDLARAHRVGEALDYGGVGESGYGHEGSRHGLEDYLAIKPTCLDAAAP